MNKNLIALAVAATTLSGAATAAEVYADETSSLAIGGRFEARGVLEDSDVTDASRVRLNIAGKTDITDNFYGLGFFEREFKSNEEKDENRYIYAGIGGEFGQIVYGKADGALVMLTDVTDIMAYHGNEAGGKIEAGDRTDNNLAYTGSFDNLTVKANYVFDDGTDADGYTLGAMYVLDMGLGFSAGYGEQAQGADTKDAKQAFAAVSYTIGDLYVAGLYQDAEYANGVDGDSRGYEFAAAYTIDKLVMSATYNYLEDKEANTDLADAIAVDATYYFNKNFRTYASYKFEQLDNQDDEFVLGARYDF